jgi:hypothetical protein
VDVQRTVSYTITVLTLLYANIQVCRPKIQLVLDRAVTNIDHLIVPTCKFGIVIRFVNSSSLDVVDAVLVSAKTQLVLNM